MAKRATLAVLVAGLLAGSGMSAWAQTSPGGNVTTPGAAPAGSDGQQHGTSSASKARVGHVQGASVEAQKPATPPFGNKAGAVQGASSAK